MKRNCIASFLVTLSLASGGGVFAADMATPSGRIVTGDTTGLEVGLVVPPLSVKRYLVPEIPAGLIILPVTLPAGPTLDPLVWGYEASSGSGQIFAYDVGPGVSLVSSCIPPGSMNGRGLAYDPQDGNLWYSTVTYPGFAGDGVIRKTTPPQTGSCTLVTQIPFGDGPGGTVQDDIGSIDVDGESKHLWVAGYKPMIVGGQYRSYLYLVNRNNGSIIRNCYIPFRFGGVGNESLTYAKLDGLPGSGTYLLTDAGQIHTFPNNLAVIDINDCKNGAQVTPVADYPKVVDMSGIDFEWPGLLATDNVNVYNLGGPPFSSASLYGPWGPPPPDGNGTQQMEDISLCASNAQLDNVQTCPY